MFSHRPEKWERHACRVAFALLHEARRSPGALNAILARAFSYFGKML
jgi:hypothetical protein